MIKSLRLLQIQFILMLLVFIAESIQAKDKIISLESKIIIEPISFYIQKVLDNREYKKNIGLKFNENTNEIDYYHFELGFVNELQKYFDFSFPKTKRFPVVLKVNYLFALFRTNKRSYWTKIKFEFYNPDGGSDSSKFSTITYGNSIESALNKAIAAYQLFLDYSEDINSKHSSIQLNKTKRKGIYANFEEFVNNSPSIQMDFDVIRNYGAGTEFIITPIFDHIYGYELNDLVWGVCDGENLYISARFIFDVSGFYRIVELNDSYVIRAQNIELKDYYKDIEPHTETDYHLDFSYYYMNLDPYSGEGFCPEYRTMRNLLMNNVALYEVFLKSNYDYETYPFMFKDFMDKYYKLISKENY